MTPSFEPPVVAEAGLPRIQLRGDARERGVQYGRAARTQVIASIEGYRDIFEHLTGWTWQRVRAEARRFEPVIRDYEPRALLEIEGIAEGAGVEYDDILALNVRTEVMNAARSSQALAAEGFRAECSAVGVVPEATRDGHTITGQNWDWMLHSARTVVLLEVQQEDRPNFVTVVEAGLLAKVGMNSAGLALTTNMIVSNEDDGRLGVPYHVVLRSILDTERVSDALHAIQRMPRSTSANYLISHQDGVVLNVETAPGDYSQVFLSDPDEGVVLHTNHYVSPQYSGKDVSRWLIPNSPIRLQRLRSALRSELGGITVETLMRALSDHANYPGSVCCHPDESLFELDRAMTVFSVIMDVHARRFWVADGPPCSTAYQEIDFRDLLS